MLSTTNQETLDLINYWGNQYKGGAYVTEDRKREIQNAALAHYQLTGKPYCAVSEVDKNDWD